MDIKTNAKIEDMPVLMKAKEVAQFWRVDPKTVYDMIKSGQLPVVKVGRLFRVHRKYCFEIPQVVENIKCVICNITMPIGSERFTSLKQPGVLCLECCIENDCETAAPGEFGIRGPQDPGLSDHVVPRKEDER
jgi:excisionase family DNA binding protein